MAIDAAGLLAAVEAQFLGASGGAGQTVETPGFRVHLWTTPDAFYRTVAAPIERPPDWDPAVTEMLKVFEAHGRAPAVEYAEERWPGLGSALERAGFAREARLTTMACVADKLARSAPPGGAWALRRLDGSTGAPALRAYLAALHAAFGQSVPTAGDTQDAAILERALAAGRTRICFTEAADGGTVAGANLVGIGPVAGIAGPVAELAGVWTSTAARGHGLARSVTSALLHDFFAAGGGLVWLATDDARASSLYAGLGFRPIGHQLRYSRRHA